MEPPNTPELYSVWRVVSVSVVGPLGFPIDTWIMGITIACQSRMHVSANDGDPQPPCFFHDAFYSIGWADNLHTWSLIYDIPNPGNTCPSNVIAPFNAIRSVIPPVLSSGGFANPECTVETVFHTATLVSSGVAQIL